MDGFTKYQSVSYIEYPFFFSLPKNTHQPGMYVSDANSSLDSATLEVPNRSCPVRYDRIWNQGRWSLRFNCPSVMGNTHQSLGLKYLFTRYGRFTNLCFICHLTFSIATGTRVGKFRYDLVAASPKYIFAFSATCCHIQNERPNYQSIKLIHFFPLCLSPSKSGLTTSDMLNWNEENNIRIILLLGIFNGWCFPSTSSSSQGILPLMVSNPEDMNREWSEMFTAKPQMKSIDHLKDPDIYNQYLNIFELFPPAK